MEWWMWLAAGLVLLVIELVTPSGFFVMFFGLGALTVGVLTALDLAGPASLQWLIFTLVSVVYVLLFRRRMRPQVTHEPGDIDTLVGEIALPREHIAPGAIGRVDLRGTLWNARNAGVEPLVPGQRCRVLSVDGLVLSVQPE